MIIVFILYAFSYCKLIPCFILIDRIVVVEFSCSLVKIIKIVKPFGFIYEDVTMWTHFVDDITIDNSSIDFYLGLEFQADI